MWSTDGRSTFEESEFLQGMLIRRANRFVSMARGECPFFGDESLPRAAEGCKSNALMRCCKDLGVASELWDPRFLRKFKKDMCKEVWVEHAVTKKKRVIWQRKDADAPGYPFTISKPTTTSAAAKKA